LKYEPELVLYEGWGDNDKVEEKGGFLTILMGKTYLLKAEMASRWTPSLGRR
jgi:hypothetical protein